MFHLSADAVYFQKYLKSGSEQHQISIAGKQKVILENVTGNIIINHSSDSGFMTVRATKEIKVKKKILINRLTRSE